jgi:hypothetical protein
MWYAQAFGLSVLILSSGAGSVLSRVTIAK